MLAFKMVDLEAHQENNDAYTTAPAHHLKSIHFLGRDMIRKQLSAQPLDMPSAGVSEWNVVLDGLRPELDAYLQELPMELSQPQVWGHASLTLGGATCFNVHQDSWKSFTRRTQGG